MRRENSKILILRAIDDTALTASEIAEKCKMSRRSVCDCLFDLMDKNGKRVYIAQWDTVPRSTGGTMPVARYQARHNTRRADAPKPPPLSKCEISRRSRAKKATPPPPLPKGILSIRRHVLE